ncbi:MAG: hypothetical protein OCD01_08405 [Fibrobacterales bacterium]
MINNFLKIGLGLTLMVLVACDANHTNPMMGNEKSDTAPILAKARVLTESDDTKGVAQETFSHRVPAYTKTGKMTVLSGMLMINSWIKKPNELYSHSGKLMIAALESNGVNPTALANGNGIQAYRTLEPGQILYFPPVDKKSVSVYNDDNSVNSAAALDFLFRIQQRPDLLSQEVIELVEATIVQIKQSSSCTTKDTKCNNPEIIEEISNNIRIITVQVYGIGKGELPVYSGESKLPLNKILEIIQIDFNESLYNEDGTLNVENNKALIIRLQKRPDLLTAEWNELLNYAGKLLSDDSYVPAMCDGKPKYNDMRLCVDNSSEVSCCALTQSEF